MNKKGQAIIQRQTMDKLVFVAVITAIFVAIVPFVLGGLSDLNATGIILGVLFGVVLGLIFLIKLCQFLIKFLRGI